MENQPKSRFEGNLLEWSIVRSARSWRIYVVEPDQYRPEHHGKVFRAALTALIAPKLSLVDPFKEHLTVGNVKHFDLVTFPEAFLPVDELLSALPMLSQLESLGCVHVGLRPTNGAADRHLIHVSEILQLVDSLGRLSEIARNDLAQFSRWLESQGDERLFNIGCLFTIDSERRLRICLHPKLIRSKFEARSVSGID